MVVPNRMVKGGIAAVVNGYRGSQLEKDYEITYVESYKDGSKFDKLLKGICGYFHFAYVLMFHKPDVVHAPSLPAVYEKYKERGGHPVFHPADIEPFTTLLTDIYDLASSSDYIRDMRINEKLGTLLTLLMEQSWHPETVTVSRKRMELAAVKEYLDEHYTEKLTLDDLAEKFFINKFYLSKIFKEAYGTTVNNYLISKRITRAKQLLRFTDMTVDEVGVTVGMGDANYFSRMFRKVEGISPREYRKQW